MLKRKKLNLVLTDPYQDLKSELEAIKNALDASKKYGIVISNSAGEIYHNRLALSHMENFTGSEGIYNMNGEKYVYNVSYVGDMTVTETVENHNYHLHDHILKHSNSNLDFLLYFREVLEKARNNLESFADLAAKSASDSDRNDATVARMIYCVDDLSKIVMNAVDELEAVCKMSISTKQVVKIIGDLAENTGTVIWNVHMQNKYPHEKMEASAAVDREHQVPDKVKHSVGEILKIAQSVFQKSEEVKDGMANIWDIVLTLVDDSKSVKKSFKGFKNSAGEVALMAKKISNMLFCNLAKLDHIIFVNKLYDYVSMGGKQDFMPEEESVRRLGIWHDNAVGKQEYSMLPSYSKLAEPHKIMYTNAHEIVNMSKGEYQNIDLLKSGLINVDNASNDVNNALDSLMQEKEQTLEGKGKENFSE